MNDAELELAYQEGSNAAWQQLPSLAIQNLGDQGDAERWRLERVEAVAQLRILRREHGDDEWEDSDQLAGGEIPN